MADVKTERGCDTEPTNTKAPAVAALGEEHSVETADLQKEINAICEEVNRLESARFTHFRDTLERLAKAVGMSTASIPVAGDIPTYEDVNRLDLIVDSIANHVGLVGFPEADFEGIGERLDQFHERLQDLLGRIAEAPLPADPQTGELA
jgi:hypothetical protein